MMTCNFIALIFSLKSPVTNFILKNKQSNINNFIITFNQREGVKPVQVKINIEAIFKNNWQFHWQKASHIFADKIFSNWKVIFANFT